MSIGVPSCIECTPAAIPLHFFPHFDEGADGRRVDDS